MFDYSPIIHIIYVCLFLITVISIQVIFGNITSMKNILLNRHFQQNALTYMMVVFLTVYYKYICIFYGSFFSFFFCVTTSTTKTIWIFYTEEEFKYRNICLWAIDDGHHRHKGVERSCEGGKCPPPPPPPPLHIPIKKKKQKKKKKI